MRQLIEARCKKRALAAKTNAGIMACLQSRDASDVATTSRWGGSERGAATSEMEGWGGGVGVWGRNSSCLLDAEGRLQQKITKNVPSSVGTMEHKRAASSG